MLPPNLLAFRISYNESHLAENIAVNPDQLRNSGSLVLARTLDFAVLRSRGLLNNGEPFYEEYKERGISTSIGLRTQGFSLRGDQIYGEHHCYTLDPVEARTVTVDEMRTATLGEDGVKSEIYEILNGKDTIPLLRSMVEIASHAYDTRNLHRRSYL